MIVADINNKETLNFLSTVPAFRKVLGWIQQLSAAPDNGITELQGQDLFINIHDYETMQRELCNWESHRHTADLQFCISGSEFIDWTPVLPNLLSLNYDATRDFEFWPEQIEVVNTIHLTPGSFVIFLPGELHRPMISDGANSKINKAVAKIQSLLLPVR